MTAYILLILIPTLCTFVALDRSYKPARIRIGSNKNAVIREHNPALFVFFAMFLAMLMLRHETVGRDLEAYKFYFEIYPTLEMDYFDLFRQESLYRLLNWGVGQFTDDFQWFIAVTSVMTALPIAWIYCEDRRNSYTKIILFVGMATFVMLFSGLRQVIALSIGMIAYWFIRKKNWIMWLVMFVLALGFHHSAFMILFMYPLYHVRFKKKHLWFILPLLAIVFVFNRQIFGFANSLLIAFNERYEYEAIATGSYTSLILFMGFAAFAYLVPDEKKMDKEMFGLRNFLLAAVFLQCFAPIHTLAMRLNYYFILFIPILLAKLMDIPRPGMERVARLAAMVIPLYFTYDFFSNLYTSYVSGVSLLDTIPYRFFWN